MHTLESPALPSASVRRAAVAACCTVFAQAFPPALALRATLEFAALAVGARGTHSRAEVLGLLARLAPEGEVVLSEQPHPLESQAAAALAPAALRTPGDLGEVYEALLATRRAGTRKQRGSYFTGRALAQRLATQVLADAAPGPGAVVLDPAMGAGRFLLEALALAPGAALHGLDTDPLAVWMARVSLVLAGAPESGLTTRLRVGDALAPGAFAGLRAHFILGNPPWLAHAGRQSVKLDARTRQDYRTRFRAFAGFPTTHGMFVELAARTLAPGGRLGLLVPTQLADLAGYGPTRAALTAHARLDGPLEELGFGQFDDVTEPTLVLLARHAADAVPTDGPFALRERADARAVPALSRRAHGVLARLATLPRFPPETFGEAGFQSAGTLSRTHLSDWPCLEARFSVPLREGRDIEPFRAGPPSCALDPDPAALAQARTRLRPAEAYARVAVLIRQTARYPIAAVHTPPTAFRNSLLAGYTEAPHALVALLNSSLLRAVHLASQRDGRQAVFPQLKVAHLRALPAPPAGADLTALATLARTAESAQQARWQAEQRFRARVGEGAKVPRTLFEPVGDTVPARPEKLSRLRPGRAGDAAIRVAYEEALAAVRAAHGQLRATLRALDEVVFTLYGVEEAARAELAALSGASRERPSWPEVSAPAQLLADSTEAL
jgi:SAM-dependent methyltransferase